MFKFEIDHVNEYLKRFRQNERSDIMMKIPNFFLRISVLYYVAGNVSANVIKK